MFSFPYEQRTYAFDILSLAYLSPNHITVMQKITPFIWLEKGAKEAADFYVSVFGGDAHNV